MGLEMVDHPKARATRALWLLIACLSVTTAAAQAPTDLVVVITGGKQFHQPSCPLVARVSSQNVKVMRRSDAVRKGLTAHDCASEPGHSAYVDPTTVKVYTQPGDNKYHLASCQKLGAHRTAVTLEEAGKRLWPCPVCHPPIRRRPTQP
jgi:hypothetical protein